VRLDKAHARQLRPDQSARPARADGRQQHRARRSCPQILHLLRRDDRQAASGAAYDIGLRKENQGALIGDADDVVDGFVASGASDKLVDVFGSGTNSVWQVDADEFDVGRPLWQIMGQAADPGENWEFYCTVQAAGTTPAVGGIVFVLEYLAGD